MPSPRSPARRASIFRPCRSRGRAAAAVVLLLLAWMVYVVFANPNFQWPVVWKYLLSKDILDGVKLTIELTVYAMSIGVSLGLVAALMRLSDNKLLSTAATAYIV